MVRPVSAFEMNHAFQVSQYDAVAPCSIALAAPRVAPTAGATRAAAITNFASAPTLRSRGAPPKILRCSIAAQRARETFATSASTTQLTLHRGQCVAKWAAAAMRMYRSQSRRGDTTSAAVSTAYGGNITAAPTSG
jgi:hypothetical protein